MRVLAIETSHRIWQFALLEGEQPAYASPQLDGGLARNLLPEIDAACQGLDWHPRELGAIVVDVGPGAFTGLRVGLTVAKSLAYAFAIPLVSVNALEIIAWQSALSLGFPPKTELVALVDALRGQWVYQVFCIVAPGQLSVAGEARLASVDELFVPGQFDRWWVGPGVDSLARHADEQQMPLSRRCPCLPSAVILGQLGLRQLAAGGTHNPLELLPLYFRPNYAEEKSGG